MSNEGKGNGNENGNGSPAPRRTARKAAVLAAVFVVGALGGGAAVMSTDAWSQWGRWGGGGSKGHHGDPARWKGHMKGHMEDHALFWLDRIDATDEQREAVRSIIGQAADDLVGAIGEHRTLRRQWLTELKRPELDAEGLEALRAQHVALLDRKSRRALDAIVEAGSVLTAEQRAELVSMLSWHRDRRDKRRRGSGKG